MEAFNRELAAWVLIVDARMLVIAAVTALAQWPVYALPTLLLALWFFGARPDRRAAVTASLAASLALIAAHECSLLIDHPRPFMIGLAPNRLDHAPDSSFPSDHTALFLAVAAGLILQPAPSLPWLGAAIGMVGLGVGWARVALGVHFPLDIVGAAVIATLSAVLMLTRWVDRVVAAVVAIGERVHRALPRRWPGAEKDQDARSPR